MKYSNGTQMIEAIKYTSSQSVKDIANMIGGLTMRMGEGLYLGNGQAADPGQFVVMACPTGLPLALNKIPEGYEPCEEV